MSFAAMTFLSEGLRLSALLTLTAEDSPICTRIPNSVHDGMAIYLTLKNINKK
jgi:hypothetical protein